MLPDNDAVLAERLDRLAACLPGLLAPRMAAAIVIGSVAEGRARDASDIDVVLESSEDVTPSSFYERSDAEEAKAMAEEVLRTAEPWVR